MKPANRIAAQKPYFFATLKNIIQTLKEEGKDVIRMDIGSPDLPPADFIIETMVEAARNPANHGYTAYGGTQAYRKAAATYYANRFNVALDPRREVVGLIGSKEGLFTLSQALLNPGDIALVPDPGYGTYKAGAEIAGGSVYRMPLLSENNFLPDLQAIPADVLTKAKVLWLNYPNNPTGATATYAFFEEAVAFAKQHDLIIAHDTPYADVCYDGYRAPSLLEIEDAKEVAVEFYSLSKVYNMAGWRLGMAVGNADVVGYIENYKSQVDTSHFEPILAAGIQALTADQSWIDARNEIYQQRRDAILRRLPELGLHAHAPKAALYIWAKLPDGLDDREYCTRALHEAGVSITPGSVYGEGGKGYVRMSICSPLEEIASAVDRLVEWSQKT